MLEQNVRQITLDHKKGQEFVQLRSNIVASGSDLPYPNERDQEPTKTHVSLLEKVPEGSHLGPFGLVENQTK